MLSTFHTSHHFIGERKKIKAMHIQDEKVLKECMLSAIYGNIMQLLYSMSSGAKYTAYRSAEAQAKHRDNWPTLVYDCSSLTNFV